MKYLQSCTSWFLFYVTATSMLLQTSSANAVSANNNNNNDHPKPDDNMNWYTLDNGIEFQPSIEYSDKISIRQAHRLLAGSTSGYENEFIDGSESYYNDYAQAWRLLGFYIDCNAPHNNFNECNENGGGGGGGDKDNDQAACQRYLLWAAYIDLDYSGGGIGEYQFYDRLNQKWDTTSCVAQSGRCAKMDCHLPDTNFKLLGFFKEPNYHEWMEQLFKHQGVCLWGDDEYYFMDTDRYLWPCYCTSTGQTDEDGNTLYYDTKPMPEGRIGIGLYTDNRCRYDYTGSKDLLEVLQSAGDNHNEYGSISELQKTLSRWNNAFDVYKVCQPCKAYNLGFNKDLNGNRQGGSGDDEDGAFDCYDDANYKNVNQCMKFKTKTEMLAADFRDIMLAHEQGNIVEFELQGRTYGYGGYRGGVLETTFNMAGSANSLHTPTILLLTGSILFMLFSILVYLLTRAKVRKGKSPILNEPLMSK